MRLGATRRVTLKRNGLSKCTVSETDKQTMSKTFGQHLGGLACGITFVRVGLQTQISEQYIERRQTIEFFDKITAKPGDFMLHAHHLNALSHAYFDRQTTGKYHARHTTGQGFKGNVGIGRTCADKTTENLTSTDFKRQIIEQIVNVLSERIDVNERGGHGFPPRRSHCARFGQWQFA